MQRKKMKKTKLNKAFKCQACGECCKVDGYIHVTKGDIKNIATHMKLSIETFRDKYVLWVKAVGRVLPGGVRSSCIFFEKGKCAIYKARPVQCRTFPYWDMIKKDKKEWKYAKTYCPGCTDLKELYLEAK